MSSRKRPKASKSPKWTSGYGIMTREPDGKWTTSISTGPDTSLGVEVSLVGSEPDEFDLALTYAERGWRQRLDDNDALARSINTRRRLMEIRAAAIAVKKAYGKRKASKELAALFALLPETKP